MQLAELIETAYTLLPPPLSAIPAKYRSPISLGLHSLASGYTSYKLATLAEFDEYSELAFILGLVHDIHQKLVYDELSTLKAAKEYVNEKLDILGYPEEYVRKVGDALEADMCGKQRPVRGLPKELATICHIGDMTQGSLEGIVLLNWLRSKIKEVKEELTVRFYSLMIPQPFARSYAMLRLYEKYIANTEHLALASPWGLYVITYENELPEVLEVSWDDLRIDPIIDYERIVEIEESEKSANIAGIKITKYESKNRLWSRFARMFYKKESLTDSPIYPKLPVYAKGFFVNIEFTDINFVSLKPEETHICGLCGLPHHGNDSLPISMYGTSQHYKIAGTHVTIEKWNRFLPAHIKVKTWDKKGSWRQGIGMCPLCALDAAAVREFKVKIMEKGKKKKKYGIISFSVPKPLPLVLLKIVGQTLRYRYDLRDDYLAPVGVLDGTVIDYNTATVATSLDVPEPNTENMFDCGELASIGRLLARGLYPLKFLPGFDTSTPDRILITTKIFRMYDFSVTDKRYSHLIPWIVKLTEIVGCLERASGIKVLMDRPEHAPLHVLSLDKSVYDSLSRLLREVGMRP